MVAIGDEKRVHHGTNRKEGESLHQGMRDQMEETARSASALADDEGNSETYQHVPDMGNTGVRQQAFYLFLLQRHQVAHQDVEAAENDEDNSPVTANLTGQAEHCAE